MIGNFHTNEDLATIHEKQSKTFVRPGSAKYLEFGMLSKPKPRLLNSGKIKTNSKTLNEKIVSDVTLLNKLKPRQINIDKERLYQENLELKMKFNTDQDEILKLKTRLLQIEKELHKKDDASDEKNFYSIKPPNLIMNLKSTIKDLRLQIQTKDDEIDQFSKNLKSSKIIELESEIKAYIDECTRLRRHLEESLGRGSYTGLDSEAEKNSKLEMLIGSTQKENKDLLKKLKDYKDEVDNLKKKLAETGQIKKTAKIKSTEAMNVKQELKKAREQNEQLLQSINEVTAKEAKVRDEMKNVRKSLKDQQNRAILAEQKSKELLSKLKDLENSIKHPKEDMSSNLYNDQDGPNKLMFVLENIITKSRLTAEKFFSMIDKDDTRTISSSDFASIMKKYDSSFNPDLINMAPKILISMEKIISIDNLRIAYQESQILAQNKSAEAFTFDSPVIKTDGKFMNLFQDKPDQVSLDRETPVDPPKNAEVSWKIDEIVLTDENKYPSKKEPPPVKRIDISKKDPKPAKSSKDSKSSQDRMPTASLPPTPPADPVLLNIFKHISYRMQLNRLPKSKLLVILFGSADKDKSLTKSELASYFSKDPFNFTDSSDQESLCHFFLVPASTIKSISDKLLRSLGDWEIFSKEDEAVFDSELGTLITNNKAALMERCKAFDKDHKGIITSTELEQALDELNLSFDAKTYNYMKLLCYSYDFKLDVVPYRYLIKAYGNSAEAEADQEGEEASDPSESLNHEHISQYLGVIAQILEQNNLAVADVFECDEHGLIFPQEFREGLRSIGLEKIEKAHVIDIIEALRFQGEKELCLHIEELDEILQGYREGRGESPEAEEEFDNRISLFGTGAGLNPTHGSEKSDNSNDLENLRGYIGRSGSVLSDEYNPFDSGVE